MADIINSSYFPVKPGSHRRVAVQRITAQLLKNFYRLTDDDNDDNDDERDEKRTALGNILTVSALGVLLGLTHTYKTKRAWWWKVFCRDPDGVFWRPYSRPVCACQSSEG
ncbi:hypothetical protein PV325_004551 [Microctonus aethiopoides]|nr:hypothetical protein PV325_004551 [Microctonus aethiopoides]